MIFFQWKICANGMYDRIDINSRKLELFLNGVMLTFDFPDGVYNIYHNNRFIGLGIVRNKLLKRDIIDQ